MAAESSKTQLTRRFGRNLRALETRLRDEPLKWRWVNELGVHNAVDARELVDALLTGRITPHVWVWRTGWKVWVRASQVADLATAIPRGARLPPVAIEVDPNAVEPPPIPHYSFRDQKFVRHLSTPIPQAQQQRPLMRRAAPTMVDDVPRTASNTLRPAGAVPPPPRTHSDVFAFDVQRALDLATFAGDPSTARAASAHQSNTSLEAAPATARPSIPPELIPVPAPDFVIQSVLSDAATTEPRPAEPSATLPAIESQAPRSRQPQVNRKLITGAAILVVAAGILLAALRPRAPAENAAPPGQSSARPPPQVVCKLVDSAERLAPSIVFSVPPIVETAVDGRSLAVGFADTPTSAAGILVDPVTRAVKYVFRNATSKRVARVVPLVAGGQQSFSVGWDSDALKDARPVPGPPAFTFGHNIQGFSRQVNDGPPELVWTTDIDAAVSGARLVSVPNVGHAVTYRQGGTSGSIWLGWLTPAGTSRKVPFALQTEAKLIGQPSIAASDATALVSFAGRATDKDRWQVHMFKATADSGDSTEQVLEQPAGGLGGDSIAPAAAGLGSGQFLMQWSEGGSGHWQVRVQTLSATLQPASPAINVSPTDANAGQGVLWVNGTHAVSLFIVNSGRSSELWAASLECPR